MSLLTAIPKSLKKFRKNHKYNSKEEQSFGLLYKQSPSHPHEYINISKSKDTGVYGMKIGVRPALQKEVDREAYHILESALGSFADWAREGAMSGGTLYRIWPRFVKSGGKTVYLHPVNESNAKIEAALKRIIRIADQKVG